MKTHPCRIRPMQVDDYEEMYSIWQRTDGIGLSESDEREAISSFLEPGFRALEMEQVYTPPSPLSLRWSLPSVRTRRDRAPFKISVRYRTATSNLKPFLFGPSR